MPVSVAISGATGRLGVVIDQVVSAMPGFEVVARLDSSTGLDAVADADVVVDATHIDVSERVARVALESGTKMVLATSGWGGARFEKLRADATAYPDAGILIVPNFSVGSVLSSRLAAEAVRLFSSVEIIEAHHVSKVDAPSGTAVRTAEQIDAARSDHGKDIAIHSVRLPGIIAKQSVVLGGQGEYLTITHETTSSDSYRQGIELAVAAAPGLVGVSVGIDALLGLD